MHLLLVIKLSLYFAVDTVTINKPPVSLYLQTYNKKMYREVSTWHFNMYKQVFIEHKNKPSFLFKTKVDVSFLFSASAGFQKFLLSLNCTATQNIRGSNEHNEGFFLKKGFPF